MALLLKNNDCDVTNMEYVSLKEYFEVRLNAISTSTKLAAESLEKRLENMNEFRELVNDQQKTFLTKSEYDIHHGTLVNDIRVLRESKALLEGKASQNSVYLAYLISALGLIIAIIGLTHEIFTK